MAYTKLFSSIITSTIWTEDDKTRIVWITMLAVADKNGEVQASIPGLARIAGVTVEACEAAITRFLSPDRHSRTKDDEGRRLEAIDGGWFLLNHKKYRDMASREDSTNSEAARKARYRARIARNKVPDLSHPCPPSVPPLSTHSLHIAEAEADVLLKKEPKEREGAREPDPAKVPTTPTSKRLALIFHRRLTTPWSSSEIQAYKRIQPQIAEEDLAALEAYYAAHWPPDRDDNILRHDLKTLLHNYGGEVDRAHNWKLHPPKTNGSAPREAPKSFAQQDAERKAADRHGPWVVVPKVLSLSDP